MVDGWQEESVASRDIVFAETIGLAVQDDAQDGPMFGIALRTPGGGNVLGELNAVQAVKFASDMLALVARTMSDENEENDA